MSFGLGVVPRTVSAIVIARVRFPDRPRTDVRIVLAPDEESARYERCTSVSSLTANRRAVRRDRA
ncbi:hypothetical protein CP557_09705 [Natrinema ejinorense]|uniref:Uncharacterized protein n=1 Tax=Natrinema ejinorense TaxID=373386 RepID=A0A2A5QVF2_9EURY|nr:hypothetical protein CP557_09705 [Natrinema ejinorense]